MLLGKSLSKCMSVGSGLDFCNMHNIDLQEEGAASALDSPTSSYNLLLPPSPSFRGGASLLQRTSSGTGRQAASGNTTSRLRSEERAGHWETLKGAHISLPPWPEAGPQVARGTHLLTTLTLDPTRFLPDELCHMLLDMFLAAGLPPVLREDVGRVRRFILAVRASMFENPYHNFFHAFDVTQTTYAMAVRTGVFARLSPWERFALLTAALCHDLEHPGVSSLFLAHVKSQDVAGVYKDVLLEKHHALRAFEVMVDSQVGLLEGLSTESYWEFRNTVSGCILATDFLQHSEYCTRLAEFAASSSRSDMPKQLEMEFLIKCADISNVLKPFEIARRWAIRVTDEFFLQGDVERELQMEITPMCDRLTQGRVALQCGFIDFVAGGYFNVIAQVFPELQSAVEQLYINREEWRGCTDEELEQHRENNFCGENNVCEDNFCMARATLSLGEQLLGADTLGALPSPASSGSRSPSARGAFRLDAISRRRSHSPGCSPSRGGPFRSPGSSPSRAGPFPSTPRSAAGGGAGTGKPRGAYPEAGVSSQGCPEAGAGRAPELDAGPFTGTGQTLTGFSTPALTRVGSSCSTGTPYPTGLSQMICRHRETIKWMSSNPDDPS